MADDVQDCDCEKLRHLFDAFESQIMEIEALQSIFSGEDEIEIVNKETMQYITAMCEKYRSTLDVDDTNKEGAVNVIFEQIRNLKCIVLNVRLTIGEEHPEVVNANITLPLKYPQELPEVFIPSNGLTREHQREWNAEMRDFLQDIASGEQVIYTILQWLKDTGENHFTGRTNRRTHELTEDHRKEEKDPGMLSSMWLYMHHIYNKDKRKDIIHWANELNLTGFSLPGKPGIVHVEGDAVSVDEYFMRLRRLSWKKMSCVHKETFAEASKPVRIFQTFEELCFDVHGGRDYHMDMGKFHLFLKEHKLGHMFSILFGIKD